MSLVFKVLKNEWSLDVTMEEFRDGAGRVPRGHIVLSSPVPIPTFSLLAKARL